jgi:hypothetical protein
MPGLSDLLYTALLATSSGSGIAGVLAHKGLDDQLPGGSERSVGTYW